MYILLTLCYDQGGSGWILILAVPPNIKTRLTGQGDHVQGSHDLHSMGSHD